MAVQKARNRFNPLTYQELIDITTVWVDAALKLNEKDLKVMDRFVRSQEKLFLQPPVQQSFISNAA
jgi:DSF synthase